MSTITDTTVGEIHESLVNGQRRQMVNQITDYSHYEGTAAFIYFSDAAISYHRIVNR